MNRTEAITILDGFKHNPLFNEQHFEAFDMAISALSAKGDLISRQAVFNIIEREQFKGDAISEIEKLPSVESKGEPIESARTLKKHCINTKDCKECFMWDECKYELSAPCDWDLPDEEKGGE